MSQAQDQISKGQRFAFGKNWSRFLATVNQEAAERSAESLAGLLGRDNLTGKRFLDAGSGSGLSSLAARTLGAEVVSFDFDPQCVACAKVLRDRFFSNGSNWSVSEGSVLDEGFLKSLGEFDMVYSWGVLHHTGDMARAMDLVGRCVSPGGLLVVALYNDQGIKSDLWKKVKKTYCSSRAGRAAVTAALVPALYGGYIATDLVRRKNPLDRILNYQSNRGMSLFHDIIDWIGGYPFEAATPQWVESFYGERGFSLEKSVLVGNKWGCNEFVFTKNA